MKLSKEEKDELSEHYRGKDLYNPATAKEQEPHSFSPKPPLEDCDVCGESHERGMCSGGEMKGYATGGGVTDDFSVSASGDTGTAQSPVVAPGTQDNTLSNILGAVGVDTDAFGISSDNDGKLKDGLVSSVVPAGNQLPEKAPISSPDQSRENYGINIPDVAAALGPQAQPAAPAPAMPQAAAQSGNLAPNQYDELVKYLSAKPSLGQSAMSGLAGLADAISTGVARAPSPGFQKNITETDQAKRRNLIDAMREKYEVGYKGQELGLRGKEVSEQGRHNLEGEKETRAARSLTQQAQDLERAKYRAQQNLEARKLATEESTKNMELAQKGSGGINALERMLGFGPPLPEEGKSGRNPLYETQQAKAIKQQYQAGKITKAQASKMLDQINGRP